MAPVQPQVEIVSDEISTGPAHDPEKNPTGVNTVRVVDQIPHSLLEELAPNGEGEYILERIDQMDEEEAFDIIQESIEFFKDDWNFPSDMRERMGRYIKGPKEYGEFYGVRAVAEIIDDQSTPIETFRAYFLGIGWAIIGTFMSTFFNSRFPSIGMSMLQSTSNLFSSSLTLVQV
jgi:hypothetical protein